MVEYGDDPYTSRGELRAVIWNIAQGRCEHPTERLDRIMPCGLPGIELAHINPRGMGHTGYRDTVNNTLCACTVHARSTDDTTSPEWRFVPEPHDRLALAEWVKQQRRRNGWAV